VPRLQRVAFRFLFVYLGLYCVPALLLGTLPGSSPLAEMYEKPWRALVPWVGKHVLSLGRDITVLYSADTTYEYVQLFCYVVLAVVVASVWTLLDSRTEDPALNRWLRIYLRYALAVSLFGYGMGKVIRQQFPFPPLERMLTPFGDSSPRGLLWTFMGYSRAYTLFAGTSEVLAGLLLCYPRTTTLGALTAAGVLFNVAMLNLCYDVQLKAFSLHLLLIAVVLLSPDLRRLANVFIFNRPVAPADIASPLTSRWMKNAGLAVKTLLIGYVLISSAVYAREAVHRRGGDAPRPALYGIFQVDEFVRNGQIVPPLATDSSRWANVIIDVADGSSNAFVIKTMDGSTRRYRLEYDATRRTVAITNRDDANERHLFAWERLDEGGAILKGGFWNDALIVRLHRIDRDLPLLRDGFSWIRDR
jgi:YD repeat-containing protein